MRLHNILFFLLASNAALTHAHEIGSVSANIADDRLINYELSGVIIGNPVYAQGDESKLRPASSYSPYVWSSFVRPQRERDKMDGHDWAYNSWRLTKGEARINFPVDITSYDAVYASFTWAGWGDDTLVNVYYNNKLIASKHAVHGSAWASPKTDTFKIKPTDCVENCFITLELDATSPMVLFFKELTIDDGIY